MIEPLRDPAFFARALLEFGAPTLAQRISTCRPSGYAGKCWLRRSVRKRRVTQRPVAARDDQGRAPSTTPVLPHPASANCSASASSTDTSWLTPTLGHRDAEQAVHARHGDRVVGDGDEAGVGALAHRLEQIAKTLDIIVIERRVDLVEHTDRRRVGEKHSEDERKRGQRLLAAGEKGQGLRLLTRRLAD